MASGTPGLPKGFWGQPGGALPIDLGENADQLGTNDANLLSAMRGNMKTSRYDPATAALEAWRADLSRQALAQGKNASEQAQSVMEATRQGADGKDQGFQVPEHYLNLARQASADVGRPLAADYQFNRAAWGYNDPGAPPPPDNDYYDRNVLDADGNVVIRPGSGRAQVSASSSGAPMPQQPTMTDPFQPFGQGAKPPGTGINLNTATPQLSGDPAALQAALNAAQPFAVPFTGQMANAMTTGGPLAPTDTNPAGAPPAVPPTFGDLGPIEQPNPEGLPPVDRSGPGGPSTFTPMGGPGEAPAVPMARPTSATGFIGRGVGRLGRQVNAFRGTPRFRPVKPRRPMASPLGTAAVPAPAPAAY